MNELTTTTNDEMVEAHALDQPEQTIEEQAASCGLDVPEFLRRTQEIKDATNSAPVL